MSAPIPEDLRERFARLQRQMKGSRAQYRYAEFQFKLIERIAALMQERDQLQTMHEATRDAQAKVIRDLRAEVERLSAVLKSIDCASCGGNNLKHKRGCEQAILARRNA